MNKKINKCLDKTKYELKYKLNALMNEYSDNAEEEETIFKMMKEILNEGF